VIKIRSVRVLSAAKVNALLYGILGLLIAPFMLLGPGLAMAGGERRGFGGAIVFAILLPFCYAVIGFIAGALLAFIYNAISHAIGGIEVELESPPVSANLAAPVVSPALTPSLSVAPLPTPPEFE
jgi:Transmembrane domain of unknown function (DUF3566)